MERKGTMFCLDSNLKASSKGCSKPKKETLLGPKRLWNNPITFRSKRVKKATERSNKTQWTIQHKIITKEY